MSDTKANDANDRGTSDLGSSACIQSVLVIDDSEDDALLAELVLREGAASARIDRATSGCDGLQMLRERSFDLVLLDLSMPGMSGFDVLEELSQRRDFTTRVVVLSSSSRPSDRQRVAAYGCEYVEKHTDFSTFRQSMAAVLAA